MDILSFKEVSKSFSHKKILKEVNFSVKKGEILGIVGPSGSGKSVLIKMLIGFIKPSSGNISFNLSPRVGFSMQNNSLYNYLTVKQNLIYFSKLSGVSKSQRQNTISLLIKNLRLIEFENTLVKKLSGGTKKRVDIACALLNNPDVIILDEPFIGLDPTLIELLSKFILKLNNQGRTIIISSHRIKELSSISSRVLLVKNKKIENNVK